MKETRYTFTEKQLQQLAVQTADHVSSCMAERGWGDGPCNCGGIKRQFEYLKSISLPDKDGARYRWLRDQHIGKNSISAVCRPREAVKLGYDVPYAERLDELIDKLLEAE